MLDDAAFRGKIALQDGDAAVGTLGVVEAVDDVLPADRAGKTGGLFGQNGVAVLVEAVFLQLLQILPQRLSGDGHHVQMQHGLDLLHHPGHAAGIVEILGGPIAGGTDVQQVVGPPVHPVKGVGVDLNAKLVGDGGQVHGVVGSAGNSSVHHDGVFKAFLGHDVLGGDALLDQLHQLFSGIVSSLFQLRSRGRHQGGARQHQAQCLGHDLHGGSSAHKGACAAAGAGVVLIVIQLAVGDDAGLFPCVKFADLLQRQQLVDGTGGVVDHIFFRQSVGFHDTAGDHDGAHLFQAANAHQHGGNGFVTTGNEHTAVIDAGVGLCLHQIDDGVTVGQRVVYAVMALCDAVTHIGGKIAGSLAAVVVDCLNRFLYELIQMGAARMAVTKGAFHHDLRLCKVFDLPPHAHLQRVIFRC